MLIAQGLVKFVSLNLRLFNSIGFNFYQMDPVTYKITANDSKKYKFEMTPKYIISALITITLALQLVHFSQNFPASDTLKVYL